MKEETVSKNPETKPKPVRKLSKVKKLDTDTAKLLASIRDKINKKDFGRKVRDVDIISRALGLLTPTDIQELQSATYSQKDRFDIAYEDFQRQHGKLSIDEFLGKLMRGEIKHT